MNTCDKVECLKTCFRVSNALQQPQFGFGGYGGYGPGGGNSYGGGEFSDGEDGNYGGDYGGGKGGYTGGGAMGNPCMQDDDIYAGGDDMGGDGMGGYQDMGGAGMGAVPESQCMIKNGKCADPDT